MRFSTKAMFTLIAVITVLITPIAWLVNHWAKWGPAEHTANVLHRLSGEIIDNNLSESEIIELLKSPTLIHHGIHKFHAKIDKQPDELIWFAPNDKFTVGLSRDGVVIWMHNGRRSGHN